MDYPHFFNAVESLGHTPKQRAAKLRVTPRSLQYWKRRGLPPWADMLIENPRLLRALIKDAREHAKRSEIPS